MRPLHSVALLVGLLIADSPAAAADSVCGRLVSIMCEGAREAFALNVDVGPFTNAVRLAVDVGSDADRASVFALLGQKVCAVGAGGHLGDRRLITLGGVRDLQSKGKPKPTPALPNGVARACDTGVTSPRVTQPVNAPMPREAIFRGSQGTVVVEAIVEPDGSVSAVRVARSVDPELDAVVVAATKQWRFTPGARGDTVSPVAVFLEFEYRVTLR